MPSDDEGTTRAESDVLGRQLPTQELSCSDGDTYWGDRAIALGETAGLWLDPWQKHLVRETLGVRDDGLWSAFEAVWIVSRQNGKSTALMVRALAGLFILGERKIVWTAHRYDTVMDAFKEMTHFIRETPELREQLARTRNEGISTTHGDESITLRTGQSIRFKTRTPDGGRGLGGDLVIIDEAQAAQHNQMSAMLPTLGAKPNPQVIYAGSAGGPRAHVLGALVHRAMNTEPDDPVRDRLYFGQWAADPEDDYGDPRTWAKANPQLGRRLGVETMAGYYNTWRYEPSFFAMEHLGVGNYPRPEGEAWLVPSSKWLRREDTSSKPVTELVLSADATPDLNWASISLAGFRSDGAAHIGVVAHERGTRWTVSRLAELVTEFDVEHPIIVDAKSPLAYLLADFEQIGLNIRTFDSNDAADATSWFLEAGNEDEPTEGAWAPTFYHPGQVLMTSALAAVSVRTRSDRVVLSRQAGDVPVSPILSAVQAGYGLTLLGRAPGPPPAPLPIVSPSSRGWDRPDFAGMSF